MEDRGERIEQKGKEKETEEEWVRTLGFAREHVCRRYRGKKEKDKKALINSYAP